jgi:transcriptional regulator with XRE-family HTH domain
MANRPGPRPPSPWDDEVAAYRQRCGRRLADARAAAGLSTYQLAKVVGMPRMCNVITRYEQGSLPSLERRWALAAALGVTVNDIWGFPDDDPLADDG